jgi:MFS family permease
MVAGQAIHGLCYAFFTSTCFIYINKVAPKDIGSTAQSLFNFIWYGIGPLLAVLLNGVLAANFAKTGKTFELSEFQPFWYSLGAITFVGLIVFILFFRDAKQPESEA